MISGFRAAFEEVRILQLRDVQVSILPIDGQVEHLIEVAVVEIAFPIDRDERAAHQIVDGSRIEAVDQFLHVQLVLLLTQQIIEKAADGHIRDGVQTIELDSVSLVELHSVFLL